MRTRGGPGFGGVLEEGRECDVLSIVGVLSISGIGYLGHGVQGAI